MRNARDSLALNNGSLGQETAKESTPDDDTLARQRTGHAAPWPRLKVSHAEWNLAKRNIIDNRYLKKRLGR